MGTIFKFIEHIHPVIIPVNALAFKNTWGLGGMALILFFLLAGSGSLMLFVYKPLPEFAYESVLHLQNNYLFGTLIRSIHYFSANFLVVIVFFHMLRVVFTRGYHGARSINWIIGLLIFCLVLLSCFTGYLLPWDQTAFWAVTISIHILDYIPGAAFFKGILLSQNEVSANTLQLFFTLHTTLIPICMTLILATHFWKIRKAKGLINSKIEKDETGDRPKMVRSMPHLFLRELVVSIVLIAVILSFASFFRVPLEEMANAGLSPNPAKAPWYFAGLQEMLIHFHPLFAAFIIPLFVFLMLISLPFIPISDDPTGHWFISKKGQRSAGVSFSTGILFTMGLIALDEYIVDPETLFHGTPDWISTGCIPLTLVSMLLSIFIIGLRKKMDLDKSETMQAIIILLTSIFITLTFTGIWLRGENMKFMWAG